jgi:hypothetical protein
MTQLRSFWGELLAILYARITSFGAIIMRPLPYPSPARPAAGNRRRLGEDPVLLLALGLFWAISVARCAWGLVRHEVFGTEGSLALLAAIGIPWLVFGPLARGSVPSDGEAPPKE